MECQYCKFYEKVMDTWGRCHRYAPRPILAEQEEDWAWPDVTFDDFCGDYQIAENRVLVPSAQQGVAPDAERNTQANVEKPIIES